MSSVYLTAADKLRVLLILICLGFFFWEFAGLYSVMLRLHGSLSILLLVLVHSIGPSSDYVSPSLEDEAHLRYSVHKR